MENWTELPALIQKDLDLSTLMGDLNVHPNFEQFRLALIREIENILNNSPEKLPQIMYRIDIDENKFRMCLAKNDAEAMADLIIEREIQKIILRKKYS